MAKRYRLTRVVDSNGPQNVKESDYRSHQYANNQGQEQRYIQPEGGQYPSNAPYPPSGQHSSGVQPNADGAVHRASRRGWMWAFISLIVVAVIIGIAVWMSDTSSSLHHLNQTTQQNAHALARQKAHLTGIQAQLQHISQQLSYISNQIGAFFRSIMQMINSGKL